NRHTPPAGRATQVSSAQRYHPRWRIFVLLVSHPPTHPHQGGTMPKTVTAFLLLIATTGTVAAEKYKECEITNGKVFSCKGSYRGTTVAFHDGKYRECDITNGRVFSCKGSFRGTAVVYHDGKY